jgi:hypothetical protein
MLAGAEYPDRDRAVALLKTSGPPNKSDVPTCVWPSVARRRRADSVSG